MKTRLSLQAKQIITFASLAFFLSTTLLTISYLTSSSIVEKQVISTIQSDSELLAEVYKNWIDKQILELTAISRYVELDYSVEMEKILAASSKRLGFNSMSPVDINGILHLPGGATVDLSQRDYLQKLFKTEASTISNPVYSAVKGEEDLLTVLMAVPIMKEGRLTGALIGQKQAEFLSEYLKSVDNGEGSSNFIISDNPIPIAHTDQDVVKNAVDAVEMSKTDPDYEDLAEIIKIMISGERGISSYTFNNLEKIIAYTPIGDLGWNVAISIPKKNVMAPMLKLRGIIFILILIGIGFSVILAMIIGRALAEPIKVIAESIEGIASGEADLTKRIIFKNRTDEIGILVNGFNQFIENLQQIIRVLKDSQTTLNTIGQEMASSSQESASAITEISANINGVRKLSQKQKSSTDVASTAVSDITVGIDELQILLENQENSSNHASVAIEEMISNIDMVTKSIVSMSGKFSVLIESAATGKTRQEAVEESIMEITSQSALLLNANTVIAGIASQTNLLAMNAAIEAAHAGTAGKGFSVVADEIRKLSETSRVQSQSIGAQLVKMEETILSVADASKESGAAYNSIIEEIEQTDRLVKEVESAMSEQKQGSRQVLEAISDMKDAGENVKEQSVKMVNGTELVSDSMKSLSEISSLIQNSMDEMGTGASQINESAQLVSHLADDTTTNISEMEKVIGKFIV